MGAKVLQSGENSIFTGLILRVERRGNGDFLGIFLFVGRMLLMGMTGASQQKMDQGYGAGPLPRQGILNPRGGGGIGVFFCIKDEIGWGYYCGDAANPK